MRQFVDILRIALFAYRLAFLVTKEEGPGQIFMHLRIGAGVYDLGPDAKPKTNIGRLFDCQFCTGLWSALIAGLLLYLECRGSRAAGVGLTTIAGAGAQALLYMFTKELQP